jgi:hypothetical protein
MACNGTALLYFNWFKTLRGGQADMTVPQAKLYSEKQPENPKKGNGIQCSKDKYPLNYGTKINFFTESNNSNFNLPLQ